MGKLLRGLHKLGLVELDDGERELEAPAVPTEDVPPTSGALAAESVPEAPLPPPPGTSGPIVENRLFEDFYAQASIPPSPYPAEKLIKVLDGLRAMQPEMRRTAVMAIDSADDTWAIEDAVLDALRKSKALEAAKQDLLQVAQGSR